MTDKPKTPKQEADDNRRLKKHIDEALDHNTAIRRELQAVMDHIRQTSRAER